MAALVQEHQVQVVRGGVPLVVLVDLLLEDEEAGLARMLAYETPDFDSETHCTT